MAEELLESPIETRMPWRTAAFTICALCLACCVWVTLVAKLFSRTPTTWLASLSEGAVVSFFLAAFSTVFLGLWCFLERRVLGRLRLISVVFPDRLSVRFQGGNVDFPFDTLTEVSIGKVKFTMTAERTNLGSSFAGRTVYVRCEPHDRRGFWNHWESIALVVGGLVLIALSMQLFMLLINPVVTSKLVGANTPTEKSIVILWFWCLPMLGSSLLPLFLFWYVGIRPRLTALLDRSLRSSRLLAISPVNPDGFYAALTTALEKYRRRPGPATPESKA